MKVKDILDRAQACLVQLPERTVSDSTARGYHQTFRRMLREARLDPLRPGIARDTYNHRRASLHFSGRYLIAKLIRELMAAAEQNDHTLIQDCAAKLKRSLDRLEPALALDPPLQPGVSSWSAPPSRWQAMEGSKPARGKGSKKFDLKKLPRDWIDTLWQATPINWPHRPALAVHMTAPSRDEDLVPGQRPHGWSPGARVVLHSAHVLEVTIAPVKHHDGKYGTPAATTKWDPIVAGGPSAYLAELSADAGDELIVSISNKNRMRKALEQLGRRAFPQIEDVVISANTIRHQLMADLKQTVGGGEQVAAAAGHSTDRTQARYGRSEYGRKLKGFLGASSARKPRIGNVKRARSLSRQKEIILPEGQPK